ncbi:MAG: hypothetical protein HZB26_08130 [Candidatus Hydrogenedentes bacterium]|nr:hypothetical protein [Candidatus Hydrogenedentota bacterium]
MSNSIESDANLNVPWWQPVLFAALAGGMGWGIRGQYGHETGAMIAGLLVSLTLTLLLCPKASALEIVRAVALGTIAIGFGGSMTYGQTIGLTQNAPVIGNWEALRWGMLGLSIKGALWIGFAGVFLGMGLSGTRYRYWELFLLLIAAVGIHTLGVYLLNRPFDPQQKALPAIYFSASWYWSPDADAATLKPRPEVWGGILFALVMTIAYAGLWKKDGLAWRLALWGLLGGAIGFPLGQCLQAYHAWNPEVFQNGLWNTLCSHIEWSSPKDGVNWWNMMETTFGTTMGAALGLGLWLNRRRIRPAEIAEADVLPIPAELVLITAHVTLLLNAEFLNAKIPGQMYGIGIAMGILPIAAVINGRWAPYLMVFLVTLIPIAGKTVLILVYENSAIDFASGWTIYGIIPIAIGLLLAIWFIAHSTALTGREFARRALLLSVWTYFILNWAVFRFPWPWTTWTSRTPNGIIFTVCVLALTGLALGLRGVDEAARSSEKP